MAYKRIISLVPSLTELLVDLGAKERLAGRTRFCIYPSEIIGEIPHIGGTKSPDIYKILDLQPDLIIANKEENRKEDIEQLSEHAEVVLTEIDTIAHALDCIRELGIRLNISSKAEILTSTIQLLLDKAPEVEPVNTAYFIWKDPWMTIGNDTYIHDVMARYGLVNIYGNQTRYPEAGFEELASLNPELILLSSEPYPFKEKHILEIQKICPESTIKLVNGEWFSWYGSRMVPSFEELNTWRKQLFQK